MLTHRQLVPPDLAHQTGAMVPKPEHASPLPSFGKRVSKPTVKYEPDIRLPDQSKEALARNRKEAHARQAVRVQHAKAKLAEQAPGLCELPGDVPGAVRYGDGPPPALCAEIMELLVGKLVPLPDDPSWKVRSKTRCALPPPSLVPAPPPLLRRRLTLKTPPRFSPCTIIPPRRRKRTATLRSRSSKIPAAAARSWCSWRST